MLGRSTYKSTENYDNMLHEFVLSLRSNACQYSGHSKPLPEYHTKISSFDERVQVMSSIRKPKTVTIRGNDERDYKFLVKGGEDLRQDQRIEQMFDIMNQIMAQDPVCRPKRFKLRTYQVVPMTPRVGLIEWMTGTTTLKDFLNKAKTPEEQKFSESQKGPRARHLHQIPNNAGKTAQARYMWVYKNLSASDIETSHKNNEALIPWDLSRRAYLQMSSSPEAYFTLRCNFAVSHALISICQYLLGIGDRHLSNFMIDLQNGCSVGIDFGHAFGSATTFLPIPELMPMRMTRQIRNLMLSLREKGLMEGSMVHCLRAMRKNADLLLTIMDVFIKEPSLDWQNFADKQKKSMMRAGFNMDGLADNLEWYPKQKVAYARKKLHGYNPVNVMGDELKLGVCKSCAEFKDVQSVLLGNKRVNIRAQLPAKSLTPEQQVACLLDLTMAPCHQGRR